MAIMRVVIPEKDLISGPSVEGDKNIPKKRYCHRCGSVLEVHRVYSNKYDPETGKPITELVYTCPNFKKTIFGLSDNGHFTGNAYFVP